MAIFSRFTNMVDKAVDNRYDQNQASNNTSSAQSPANKDFQVSGGVLRKYTGTDVQVNIPNNLGITSIGDRAFFKRSDIISVKMPMGILSVGNYAFAGCENLRHIIFSSTLNSLGNYAFENCKSLEGVSLPDGVSSIGSYAFSGCKSLTRATLPDNLKAINNFMFNKCESLYDINIPPTVTTIGWSAFSGCQSLTSIELPPTVTTIGNNAFQNCGFSEITIPDRVSTIGEGAFFLCQNLASIKIAGFNGNFVIEDGILYNRDKNTLLLHPAKLHPDATSFTLPFGVASIGYGAFSNCTQYKTIDLGDSLVKIDGCAFFGCLNLTKLKIPDSVISIGKSAFQKCTGLVSIYLPSSLTTIESGLLSGCENLVLCDIPENVNTIGQIAFFGCTGLSSVVIPDRVTTISRDAFSHCNSLRDVEIGRNVSTIDRGAFGHCAFLEQIIVDENNTEYCDKEGVLFSKDGTTLLCYPAGKYDDTYSIPDGVTRISEFAFCGANNLVTLNIPSSIQMIGTSAFAECVKLSHVYIAENVSNIGAFAFNKCTNLDFILLPSSIRSIETNSFSECDKLTIFCDPTSYGYKFAMEHSIKWSSLAPERVSGISLVKSTHKSITLAWNPLEGKVEYQLFLFNQAKNSYELAGRCTGNEYTFDNLKPGSTYMIKIAACRIFNTGKFMGSYSDEISVMTNPGKVENLTAKMNTINSIILSWDLVPTANEYQVYMLNGETDIYDLLTSTKTNRVLLTGLTPGTNNQYKVMAVTNYNSLKLNGPFSDVLSTGTSIGVITGLKCLNSTPDSITICWDEINDAYRYIVYQLDSLTGKYEELESTERNTLTFEDLNPGDEFSFKVACVKMIDRKECIGTPSAELKVGTSLPAVRGAMMASHTPTSVKLNWVKVNKATSYEVAVLNPMTNQYEPAGTTENNFIVFNDLTPMQTYKYKIMAIREEDGNRITGVYSSPVTADTIC